VEYSRLFAPVKSYFTPGRPDISRVVFFVTLCYHSGVCLFVWSLVRSRHRCAFGIQRSVISCPSGLSTPPALCAVFYFSCFSPCLFKLCFEKKKSEYICLREGAGSVGAGDLMCFPCLSAFPSSCDGGRGRAREPEWRQEELQSYGAICSDVLLQG
jgi:hypothetical protein